MIRACAAHGLALLVTLIVNTLGLGALLALNRPPAPAPPPQLSPLPADFVYSVARRPPAPAHPRNVVATTASAPAGDLPIAPAPPSALPAVTALGQPTLRASALVMPLLQQELGVQAADLVMSEEEADEAPRVLRRVPPDYPWRAADEGVEGSVALRLLVDRAGRVEELEVERAQPPGVFEQAALDAVRRWTFAPGRFQGQPVSVWCKTEVVFRMETPAGTGEAP